MWKESVHVPLLQATIYERTLILTFLYFSYLEAINLKSLDGIGSLYHYFFHIWWFGYSSRYTLSPRDIQARIRSSSWIRWWIQLVCFSSPRTWHPQYTSHTSRCACHACCRKLPYMVSRPVARGVGGVVPPPPPPWRLKVHILAIHLVQDEWTHFWSWVDT